MTTKLKKKQARHFDYMGCDFVLELLPSLIYGRTLKAQFQRMIMDRGIYLALKLHALFALLLLPRMSATEEPHITVDNTMGAAFIGVICAARKVFSGAYPRDLWYIKCLVAIVWLFDSIHQALISHTGESLILAQTSIDIHSKKNAVYFYVVTNFNNVSEQANLVCFLTMRVWKMSNQNKPLTVLIVLFVLGELTCSVVPLGFSLYHLIFEACHLDGLDTPQGARSAFLSPICIDFTYYRAQSLSMTVNVLGAVADVMIAAGQDSKMYSNSLLATLNARKSIRGLNDEDGGNVSFSLQTFSNKLRPSRRNMTMAPNQTNISIKIDTTQELIRDKATKEKDFESDITDVGRSEDTSEAV
ncbi:hypothetical protein F5890DRAFT_1612106 [Lentinula detonsa]|uniref:Uncharacterized protein n=1 Tax=Lentinula detonsa TaxID=2804962 RepID=A0AA38QAJ7_9AGAR|nr:hypothetical protein F5890DRAFT_1612106 [Lentinula detonsa]